jgi:hypothetical protein
MKRPRHRTQPRQPVTVDTLRSYMQAMSENHNEQWSAELMSDAPYWIHMLGLHLRMIELDRLEEAVGELL